MTIIILIGVIAAVGYWVSLRIHPLTKCRVCNGGGRHFGTVWRASGRGRDTRRNTLQKEESMANSLR